MKKFAAALAVLALGASIVANAGPAGATPSATPALAERAQAGSVVPGGPVPAADVGAPLGSSPVAPNLPILGSRASAASTTGSVLTRGDASFYGSTGNIRLNKPIVGMAATPDGHGYWLVASDGGIFSFGDAGFYGSTGNIRLNKPIVGMAATPDGHGYWMVEGAPEHAGSDPFTPALVSALASRTGVVSASVLNLTTGKAYNFGPNDLGFTASIVKVEILGTLLSQAQKAHRRLTASERSLATSMIEYSNNNSATALWDQVGRAPAVDAFDRSVGMTSTTPATAWGLTTTTAADQVTLLAHIVEPNNVLTDTSRSYIMHLMENVIPGQDWGVSAGAALGSTVALKNGWLPVGNGWTVNSIGWVNGSGRQYLIAVLCAGEPTEYSGITSIQMIARNVWSAFGPK